MARTRIWMMEMTEAVIHLPFYGLDGKWEFTYECKEEKWRQDEYLQRSILTS